MRELHPYIISNKPNVSEIQSLVQDRIEKNESVFIFGDQKSIREFLQRNIDMIIWYYSNQIESNIICIITSKEDFEKSLCYSLQNPLHIHDVVGIVFNYNIDTNELDIEGIVDESYNKKDRANTIFYQISKRWHSLMKNN